MAVTLCIRCGKTRIFEKTWSEHIGNSDLTYTQSICPDSECQKQVEELLKDRQDLQTHRLEESLKRRKDNREKSVLERKNRTNDKVSAKKQRNINSVRS